MAGCPERRQIGCISNSDPAAISAMYQVKEIRAGCWTREPANFAIDEGFLKCGARPIIARAAAITTA
jgi:hypothetical protein